jgi:mannose-6-phosphate isomerase-like protein (cupin superfamily)
VARNTTIAANTRGVADVKVLHPDGGATAPVTHGADILFGFVMSGAFTLHGEGRDPVRLEPGDAYVIPPGMDTEHAGAEAGTEVLEVVIGG